LHLSFTFKRNKVGDQPLVPCGTCPPGAGKIQRAGFWGRIKLLNLMKKSIWAALAASGSGGRPCFYAFLAAEGGFKDSSIQEFIHSESPAIR